MRSIKKKTLVVSLGYEGGCLYYANSLIEHLDGKANIDLWVSSSSENILDVATKRIPLKKGLYGQLLFLLYSPFIVLYTVLISLFKYDKVLVFGPNNYDALFLLAFRLIGKDSFLIIHDGVMHSGEDDCIHQTIQNCAMVLAKKHIFLTNYVSELVKKQLKIVRPSFIIPHGPITYGIPRRKSISKKIRLLVVGRLTYYKGLDIIKDIIPELNKLNYTLTIAGKITSEYSSYFENENDVIVINKYLSDSELNDIVNDCDIILMPYMEATQSGIAALSVGYAKPAIITQVGGLPEQLDKKEAYYMENVDSASLLDILINIRSNVDEYYHKIDCLIAKRNNQNWDVLSSILAKIMDISE